MKNPNWDLFSSFIDHALQNVVYDEVNPSEYKLKQYR